MFKVRLTLSFIIYLRENNLHNLGFGHFYNRREIYGDYKDNAERSIFFSKSVLEFLKYIKWKPEIIHCNDWQTALIPILLKNLYNKDLIYKNIRTVFTIHNLAYQGIFPKGKFAKTGLNKSLFNSKGLEFRGKLNFMIIK